MHNEQKRTGSEKIEIAAQIGTMVLGTVVSAMLPPLLSMRPSNVYPVTERKCLMQIRCSRCQNDKRFTASVWVRTAVRFKDDGTLTLLHTRFLEPIEEKIINVEVKCVMCKANATLIRDPHNKEHLALEAL
jgi:hypothetical protein